MVDHLLEAGLCHRNLGDELKVFALFHFFDDDTGVLSDASLDAKDRHHLEHLVLEEVLNCILLPQCLMNQSKLPKHDEKLVD